MMVVAGYGGREVANAARRENTTERNTLNTIRTKGVGPIDLPRTAMRRISAGWQY